MKLLIRKSAGLFVADLVLVETDWVLSSLYDWTREEIADGFARLLQVHNLQFEGEISLLLLFLLNFASLRLRVSRIAPEVLPCRESTFHAIPPKSETAAQSSDNSSKVPISAITLYDFSRF